MSPPLLAGRQVDLWHSRSRCADSRERRVVGRLGEPNAARCEQATTRQSLHFGQPRKCTPHGATDLNFKPSASHALEPTRNAPRRASRGMDGPQSRGPRHCSLISGLCFRQAIYSTATCPRRPFKTGGGHSPREGECRRPPEPATQPPLPSMTAEARKPPLIMCMEAGKPSLSN